MLMLNDQEFASSSATYFEEDPSLESTQNSIHVSILLNGDVSIPVFARVDPATPWVVLNSELNKQLGLCAASSEIELQTAAGLMKGSLERYPIILQAEQGYPLEIDATLFVCDNWQRENFLGYSGFIERIRFAVDPLSRKFYFGSLS